jgi:peptide deformylase
MPIVPILQYPDARLGKTGEYVTDFGEELQKVVDDMLETLHNTENCAGLAATQLAFEHPKKITVLYDYRLAQRDPPKDAALCLINPEVIFSEGQLEEPEGCMSVPGGVYEVITTRAYKVIVKAFDREGKPFEIEGEGYMAKLLQHEIDHLNGIIFIDRLSRLKRQRIDKKLSKLKKWADD